MRNRFFLCLLLYGLLFAGLLLRSREMLAFMMPFLVYLGTAFFFRPEQVRLTVTRSLSSDRAFEGSTVGIGIEITNKGNRLEELFLQDLLPGSVEPVDGSAALLVHLEPGATLRWRYSLKPGRGDYLFHSVRAAARDHSGLFTRQGTLPLQDRLMILPKFHRLKPIFIRPRRTRGHSGLIPSRTGGAGLDFFGVREYQQGDPPRLINWKATARHPRSFFTNEFEMERVADVGLILDVRWRSYFRQKEEELFEKAVSAAASCAESFLSGGNRVGLFIYGRVLDWTFPGYGNIQKERILQALSRARISSDSVFDNLEYLPTRLFPSHSQLVFISPLVRDDLETLLQIRARGYEVMVISPDPVSFEEDTLKRDPDYELGHRIASIERGIMLREIQQVGVKILNWRVNIPFHHVTGSRFALKFTHT